MPGVDLDIRPARASDQKIIRRMIYRARLNPLGLSWVGFALVVTSQGEIVGCGQIKTHRDGAQELASIAVEPDFQGRGIATALIEHLQRKSLSDLWLTCRSGLIPFYMRFGFSEVTNPLSMPGYFRRVWRAFHFINRWIGVGEALAVMHWTGVVGENTSGGDSSAA